MGSRRDKNDDSPTGVRDLAVKFASLFQKSNKFGSIRELPDDVLKKHKMKLSEQFVERIVELKKSEGQGRGQMTGMYMQYILDRIVREYYQVPVTKTSVSIGLAKKLTNRFNDSDLDVQTILSDYYDLEKSFDPIAPLLAYTRDSPYSRSSGDALRPLYEYIRKHRYDLYTEYRSCIFKILPRKGQVKQIITEYLVSGYGHSGRIDIFCDELLIDSKCTVRDDFNSDLTQLLLYKILSDSNNSTTVKQLMIVNPHLGYVYSIDVTKWTETQFRKILKEHDLNKSVSDSDLPLPPKQESQHVVSEQLFFRATLSFGHREYSTITSSYKKIGGDEVNPPETHQSEPVQEMKYIHADKWKDLVKEYERYPALKDFSSWTQQRWDETSMIQKIGFICMVETYRGDFSLTISPEDTEKLLFQMERFGYTEHSHVFGLRYLEYLKQRGKTGIICAIIDPDQQATTALFEAADLELLSQAPVVEQIVEEHLESFGSDQWNQLPEVFQLAVLYYIDQRLTEKQSTPYDTLFDRIRYQINCQSGFFGKYQELHPCPEESYAIEEISRDTEADEPIGEEDISISNVSTPQNSMRKETEHVNLNSIDINDSCISPNESETQLCSESMPPIRPQESTVTSSVDEMERRDVKRQTVEQEVSEHTKQLAEYRAEIEVLKRQVDDNYHQHKLFEISSSRQISLLKKNLTQVEQKCDEFKKELTDVKSRLEQVECHVEQNEFIVNDLEVRFKALKEEIGSSLHNSITITIERFFSKYLKATQIASQ